MWWIAQSWREISTEWIENSWKHIQFLRDEKTFSQPGYIAEVDAFQVDINQSFAQLVCGMGVQKVLTMQVRVARWTKNWRGPRFPGWWSPRWAQRPRWVCVWGLSAVICEGAVRCSRKYTASFSAVTESTHTVLAKSGVYNTIWGGNEQQVRYRKRKPRLYSKRSSLYFDLLKLYPR